MTKKETPKCEITLLVDDVRTEIRGKLSLIGLYGNNITIFKPPPLTLPKLCFLTRIIGGEGEQVAFHSLLDPSGKEILVDKPQSKIAPIPNKTGNIVLIVSPFNIEKEGTYTYMLSIEKKMLHSFKFDIVTRERS